MEKINESIALLREVSNPMYWLKAMVLLGELSESEAGYILIKEGIK